MSKAPCTCQRYRLNAPDGSVLEGELVRDPDCRQHGFPTDKWPAGHPLIRHRKCIVKATGDVVTFQDARAIYGQARVLYRQQHGWDALSYDAVIREETPRETEARLYQESLGRRSA